MCKFMSAGESEALSAIRDGGSHPGAASGRMRLTAMGSFRILMIYDNRQFYIDGAWVDPVEPRSSM